MVIDETQPKGTLVIELRDAEGNIKENRVLENLIVNSGKALFASRLIGTAAAVTSHMAVGTGTTAAAVTQTALVTESARVALASTTNVTTAVTNDSVQYVANFPAGTGTAALTEAGLFNAASAGTMVSRVVFPVVNKGANDALSITWKIQFQ